ncbi:site-specific integrase [Mesorhizobium sp. M0761]|uniref:site-specific integrase n=1 Tax=Mesorhizobium sp. M0761 TaxID=2956994 RepID=UPI0033372EB9
MARMKYIQRRANRFEFRFALPDDIAGRPFPMPWPEAVEWCVNRRSGRFKNELVKSLRTNDQRTAERAALPLIEEAHRLVDLARKSITDGPPAEIAPATIDALAAAHTARLMRNDEALRRKGLGLDLDTGAFSPDGAGMTDGDIAAYRAIVASLDKLSRDEVAKMRGSEAIHGIINKSVEDAGIVLHPDDPAWRQLELAFIRAQSKAVQAIAARLNGEEIATPDLPTTKAQPLTTALANWSQSNSRSARKPRQESINEATRAVQRFVELHGDLDVGKITKTHTREFRDALARVPKRLPHKLAKMRLPELLKNDLSAYEPRDAQTINKSLNLLAGVLTKAEKDGHFDAASGWSNPFYVTFDVSTMEKGHYEPFSVDELNKLFSSPVFVERKRQLGGKGEAAFWFPVIALYAGARRSEIAQLRLGDIRTGGAGIAFIDFNDDGDDQNLKTTSSARSVPIHRDLIAAGLLDYVAERAKKAKADDPLWAEFSSPIGPKAKLWSKWFGRYLGEYAVDSPSKTFHSFRHTFKRACREAGISEEVHHAFTGHAGGGVGRSYGRMRRSDGVMDRGISLERLKAEIDRVTYDGLVLPRWKSHS